MRLLNIHTWQFREFFENEIPQYHILSHRWGEDEISYEEFCRDHIPDTRGHRKVVDFARFVRHRWRTHEVWTRHGSVLDSYGGREYYGYRDTTSSWVWVDTCCIDKRSSAELTESINSMFKWYAGSHECIVPLTDVPSWEELITVCPYSGRSLEGSVHEKPSRLQRALDDRQYEHPSRLPEDRFFRHVLGRALPYFKQAVWFTRGWTLQELLAPKIVIFCNASWEILGHICKTDSCAKDPHDYGIHMTEIVSAITGIPGHYLDGVDPLYGASIAQRMSWASCRSTTRTEDEAYCLLGLFDVNMPMLYGEGRKAFRRLQVEIIQKSTDESIFAFTHNGGIGGSMSILAKSPLSFSECAHIRRMRTTQTCAITNNGLRLQRNLYKPKNVDLINGIGRLIWLLDCRDGVSGAVTIELRRGAARYYRYIGEACRPVIGKLSDENDIYVDTGVEDDMVPIPGMSPKKSDSAGYSSDSEDEADGRSDGDRRP